MTSEEVLKFDNNIDIDDLFKSNLATDELIISRSSEMYVGVKEINARISSSV